MQQINLYSEDLKPKKTYFSFKMLVFSNTVLFIFLIAVYVTNVFQVSDLKQSVAGFTDIQTLKKQSVESLKQQIQTSRTEVIEDNLVALRNELSEKKQLKNVIQYQSLGSNLGYSDALKTLAKSADGKIQLKGFRFVSGLQRIEFEGVSRDSRNATDYLDRLAQKKVFELSRFGLLSIHSGESENNHLAKFSVGLTQEDGVK